MCLAIENDRTFAGLNTDKLIEFVHFLSDFLSRLQVHEDELRMFSRKKYSAIINIRRRRIFNIDNVPTHKHASFFSTMSPIARIPRVIRSLYGRANDRT